MCTLGKTWIEMVNNEILNDDKLNLKICENI